jgi:flagellar biosynthesis/type III secretory pathway chaperone
MQKDMDTLYESLLIALGQEYGQYEALRKALKDESAILKKTSLEHILENNARKEAIVLSLNMTAGMRRKAVDTLAAGFHLDEPVSLTTIIERAPISTRQILSDYQEKFADIMEQVQKLNEANKNLISFSLTHVRNTFNYINSLVCSNPNYDHHGQIKAGNLQGRLISQAG